MSTKKPSRKVAGNAAKLLEGVAGPLTMASMLKSVRLCDETSQTEFAARLGISRVNLCDIEKGRKLVSPKRAAAFARKLGKVEPLWVQVALRDELRAAGLPFSVKVEAA